MSNLEKVKEVIIDNISIFASQEDLADNEAKRFNANRNLQRNKQALTLLDEYIEENVDYKSTLEYVDENLREDDHVKRAVQIALGKRPKIKVIYSNIGKYFSEAFSSKEGE